MAIISNVELPDELLHSIERRAASQNIPMEAQLVRDLILADREQIALDEIGLLAEIRHEREEMAARGVFLTEGFFEQAKSRGRR